LRFAGLDTGPFALGTRNLVAQAETFDAVKKGSYELRVLKMPSVYTMAVWLKNLGAGDDIVLPIPSVSTAAGAPTGGSLPQSPTDFIKGLQSPARSSLGFDSRPEAGVGQGPPSGLGGTPPAGMNSNPKR